MKSTSRTLLTLPMLVLLAACQTTRTTATTDKAACSIWSNVTYSGSQDSSQTVAEIRALNAKRDAYCGKPK